MAIRTIALASDSAAPGVKQPVLAVPDHLDGAPRSRTDHRPPALQRLGGDAAERLRRRAHQHHVRPGDLLGRGTGRRELDGRAEPELVPTLHETAEELGIGIAHHPHVHRHLGVPEPAQGFDQRVVPLRGDHTPEQQEPEGIPGRPDGQLGRGGHHDRARPG